MPSQRRLRLSWRLLQVALLLCTVLGVRILVRQHGSMMGLSHRAARPRSPGHWTDVCVKGDNPRTGSLFVGDFLAKRGGGRFRYTASFQDGTLPALTTRTGECKPDWPVVRVQYLNSSARKRFIGSSEILVDTGDELCLCQHRDCGDRNRIHFRQYFGAQYQEWAHAQGTVESAYLPLGPRHEFGIVESSPLASERKHLFNLIISLTTPDRESMFSTLNRTATQGLKGHSVFMHLVPKWEKDLTSSGYIAPGDYKQVLVDSAFTLCPSGRSPEAFRIFEAVEAGSIPVLARSELSKRQPCRHPLSPFQGAPFVWVRSWPDAPEQLQALAANRSMLDERQARLRRWQRGFWGNVTRSFECFVAQWHAAAAHASRGVQADSACAAIWPHKASQNKLR